MFPFLITENLSCATMFCVLRTDSALNRYVPVDISPGRAKDIGEKSC